MSVARTRRRGRHAPGWTLALALTAGCAPEPPAPRNLLLVTMDAVAADGVLVDEELSPLGPLRAASVEFTRCTSAAPHTAGALAAAFAGVHPREAGSPGPTRAFAPPGPTLAEHLAAGGWQTAAFVASGAAHPDLGWGRGFARVHAPPAPGATLEDDDVARAARRWLLHGRDPARPFFLWVHLNGGHGPYASERDEAFDTLRPLRRALREARPEGPRLALLEENEGPDGIPRYQHAGRTRRGDRADRYLVEHDLAVLRAAYLVAELRQVLRVRDLGASTVLALLGTHAEAVGAHGLWFQHGDRLRDEDLHVPLWLRVPGRPGARSDALVGTVDLAPTLLGVLGLGAQEGARGEDLLAAGGPRRGWAFSETAPPQARVGRIALREADRVLLSSGGDPAVDPGGPEVVERASQPAQAPRQAPARDAATSPILDRLETLRALPTRAGRVRAIEAEERARWEAIGYVGTRLGAGGS